VQSLGMRLAGDLIGDVTDRGEPVEGDTILLILNAWHEPIDFTLPETKLEHHWERLFDTSLDGTEIDTADPLGISKVYKLSPRSIALFVTRIPEDTGKAVSEVQLEAIRRS
jgi:isoamylase